MFSSVKMLSLFFVLFSVVSGIFSSNLLSMWFFLELSTISFLFFIMSNKHISLFKEVMKLFLMQALSGMSILLVFLLDNFSSSSYSLSFLLWLIVLFKMGAIPFHSWLMNLSNSLSWETMFLFLTLMKFIPIMILTNFNNQFSEFFSILSFLVSSVSSIFCSSLKKLMVLSSLYFLGMVFFSINTSEFWMNMMLVYVFMFLPMFFVFSNLNNAIFMSNWMSSMSTFFIFLFIISMAGLPPLPGFFLKYIWMVTMSIDLVSLTVFFLTSAFMMYLYLSFAMKNLSGNFNLNILNSQPMKFNFSILWISILPSFIAIYFL